MELFFLRHGVAADAGPAGTGDAGRPLTEAGVEKMQQAARGMQRLDLQIDTLLSSPLVRAHQTAEITADALGLDVQLTDLLAPGCDRAELLQLIEQHRDSKRLMVVGHEPDFSTLIGDLTGGHVQMKKGGLARVDLDPVAPESGVLVWLMTSSILRAAGR